MAPMRDVPDITRYKMLIGPCHIKFIIWHYRMMTVALTKPCRVSETDRRFGNQNNLDY
jgi:hypothetical protein